MNVDELSSIIIIITNNRLYENTNCVFEKRILQYIGGSL